MERRGEDAPVSNLKTRDRGIWLPWRVGPSCAGRGRMEAVTPALDLRSDDLARQPWTYPGVPVTVSGLLHEGHLTELGVDDVDASLADLGVPGLAERTCVVAVGSNASAVVLHRKLASHGVSTTLPLRPVEVSGIGVGFSAHVSRPGFVPCAPFRAPGHLALLVAAWLDDRQLACVDATEPTYVRTRLPASDVRADEEAVQGYFVYDSLRGVLGDAEPWQPPATQDQLWQRLSASVPGVRRVIADLPDVRQAMLACAADAALRDAVTEAFGLGGLVLRSGLRPS